MESMGVDGASGSALLRVHAELKAATGELLERIESALAASWPSAGDSAERARMMSAVRWLKQYRPQVHARLHGRLAEGLTVAREPHAPGAAELRFLGGEELAILLQRDRLVANVMARSGADVAALAARLTILRDRGACASATALSPGAIADGLLAVWPDFAVPQDVQRLLMAACAEHGIETILDLYLRINAILAAGGIALAQAAAEPPSIVDAAIPRAGAIADRNAANLVRSLRRGLHRLQRALSVVAHGNWRSGLLRELIQRQFAESGSWDAPAAMSPAQAQSIDRTESLLLAWIRDEQISARVRDEFCRLALPLVVMHLADAEQFAATDNPLHRFLRQLALLGQRDREFPLLSFASLQMIVGRVVESHGEDAAAFGAVAEALDALSRHEVRRRLAIQAQHGRATAADRPDRPGADFLDAFEPATAR